MAAGLTVHNCSEYMFLDDTACNLASLNVLTFFDAETKAFDVEAFKHGCRIWTIVLEISVLMASFPSEEIATSATSSARSAWATPTWARCSCRPASPTTATRAGPSAPPSRAVLTGESYATSALMARELGPFPGYADNKPTCSG